MNQLFTRFESRNTLIVLLFLFQQGILLPFMWFVPIQSLMIGFSLFLLSYAVSYGGIRLISGALLLILFPLSLLLLKIPFEPLTEDSGELGVVLRMTLGFLTMGISGILIGTLNFSESLFLFWGNRLAWVNFVFIGLIPFTPMYGFNENTLVEYMRFGYAMLPTVLFAFYGMIKWKNKWSSFLFFISLVELIVFGARGAFVTVIFMIALYFFFSSRYSKVSKMLILLGGYIFSFLLPEILRLLSFLISSFGVNTYSIRKYIDLIEGADLASTSSGRDLLYPVAWNDFINSPIFGTPLNSCKEQTGFDYYHNVFLDILANFGIFVFLLFVIFLFRKFQFLYTRASENSLVIFLILFTIPFGRLLLSSSFWLRPEFWLFLSYCVNKVGKGYY